MRILIMSLFLVGCCSSVMKEAAIVIFPKHIEYIQKDESLTDQEKDLRIQAVKELQIMVNK